PISGHHCPPAFPRLHHCQTGRVSRPARLLPESSRHRPAAIGSHRFAVGKGQLMTARFFSPASIAAVATVLACALPAVAKDRPQPAPDWAVTASKTLTPANIKDASAVILFDEYLITVDERNRAVERE